MWSRALIAAMLLTAACTRFASVGTDTVGPGYVQGGGDWDSGGGITVVARVFERGGATVVCGAWTTDRQSVLTAELNDDIIETGSIHLDGDRVAWNLGFMTELRQAENLSGVQANCVASGKRWRPAFAEAEPRIHLPRLSFVLDASSRQRVTFRPGPRPRAIR
jgi:hypothetical protein